MKKNCLIFYNLRSHKYSINALLGSMECNGYLDKIDVILAEDILLALNKLYTKYDQILVCISFFTSEKKDIFDLIKSIKTNFPKIVLVAGGPHPSGDPKETLLSGFDIVVRGEGEKTILEIIEWSQNLRPLSSIDSICYVNKDKIVKTKKSTPIDLNNYYPFCNTFKRFGPIEITRGCPYGCYFCETSYIFGKKPRHRSIDNILKLVETLFKRGIRDIRFITPNAFSYGSKDGMELNLKKLEELLKEIRKIIKDSGRIFLGSFPSEVRPEHVTETTLELIKKYVDNNNLVIGCQSGSERILEKCNRGHTVSHVINATLLCKKFDLIPKIDFIFGLPGEEQKDINESIRVMEELIKIGAKIHAHTFIPLPGTPFAKEKTKDISGYYPFINRVLSKGKLFGDFEKQRKIALKLNEDKIEG